MAHHAAFEKFHAQNPQILFDLISISRKFRDSKRCRYLSFRMIWEYYRATRTLEIQGDGEFALNNNYVPHYTRLVMETAGDLAGVFRVRSIRGEAEQMSDAEYLAQFLGEAV